MPPNIPHYDSDITGKTLVNEYTDFYGVRICPPIILFKHGYDGKTYEGKIVLTNVGKSAVWIRTTKPNSHACKMKRIDRKHLSAGLSISRKISFLYTHMGSDYCTFVIYINDNPYDYHVHVDAPQADISIVPTSIEFGAIDIGHRSVLRTLRIKNSGSKATRFFVDYNNDKPKQQILVQPNKGVLQPKSSITVRLRLISSAEGHLNTVLWIKCNKQLIVPLSAIVIQPRFEPINLYSTPTFSLIDFPVTYIGVANTRTIFVRNYSAVGATFCFMGEQNDTLVGIKACKKISSDYQFFDVLPYDGRCESKEVKAFQFR